MIITDIKKALFSKLKKDVYIDYECAFPLYESDIKKLSLNVNDELTKDRLDYIIENLVKKNALNDALRLISRTDYSKKMLSKKLNERKYPSQVIEFVLDYFEDRNYIDDYAYSERFVKNAFDFKKKGKAYVEAELAFRGIPKNIISELTEKYYSGDDIFKIAENKIKNITKGNKPDIKDYMKLKNYLLRQGYSYDEISSVITNLKGKYED